MRTWHRSCMKRTFGQSNDVQVVDTFPLGVWRPVGGVRSVRHMELVEKVGPVRHTEARRKVCLARRMGPLGPLGKCALLGVWRPVEARILCGVGRKRRNGARLHEFGNVLPGNATMGPFLGRIFSALFSENYVTWPFVELSYSVRAFAGFFLRNKVYREAPLSRFLSSRARDAARFSYHAFRRKVSASRDWSCFEYHVFYGCEQQKWKHQIGG